MARPAPAVQRTVRLLKFLAEQPRETFSLSTIARRLDFNKATCHAMLTELVEAGMLIRHPEDKTYMLGPALVNLGTAAALDASDALELARGEMNAIHRDLDVSCIVTGLVGSEIVVLARHDVNRPLFGYLPVGNRSPLRAPFGAEYMAWANSEAVERWLDLHRPELGPEQRAAYYPYLDEIRRLGYHGTSIFQTMAVRRILELLVDVPGARELDEALKARSDPADQVAHPSDLTAVMAVRVPVFSSTGRVAISMNIGQFAPGFRDIEAAIARVQLGARRITEALHGVVPVPDWARPISAGGRLPEEPAEGPAAAHDKAPAKSAKAPTRRSRATVPEGTGFAGEGF